MKGQQHNNNKGVIAVCIEERKDETGEVFTKAESRAGYN
jgi:hypothetical protein